MEDGVNVNEECNTVSMVTIENETSSSFTSEQLNTLADGSDLGCPMKNNSSYPDDQSKTSSMHENAAIIKKVIIN